MHAQSRWLGEAAGGQAGARQWGWGAGAGWFQGPRAPARFVVW